ncbi:MAG: molybdate ABC transporter substrate-binding protein [Hyphomicrobiaceae bacterium]|nr:molybdate ABC transporter substrate-binding protein [Hyphomicrobiaceae bacterium]
MPSTTPRHMTLPTGRPWRSTGRGATRCALALLAALGLMCAPLPPAVAQPRADVPIIAAAANLRGTLEEILKVYERRTGQRFRISYGSSGNLARQIANKAPFALFLSADAERVRWLEQRGRTQGVSAVYALGRLAIVTGKSSPVAVDARLDGLKAALASGRVRHLAIANPRHAPYGVAAMEALQRAGLSDAVRDRLALGENVAQALQFALSGAADGALVAVSLLSAPSVAGKIRYAVIPAEWHRPLEQRMVVVKDAGEAVRSLYRFLLGPEARAILAQRGYAFPLEPRSPALPAGDKVK